MRSSIEALLNKDTKFYMIHQQTETHVSAAAYALRSLEILMSAVTFIKVVINYQNTNNILTDAITNMFGIETFVVSTLLQQRLVDIQPEYLETLSPVIRGD